MRTQVETIGAGRLAVDEAFAARRREAPAPWLPGTFIGQHLSVTRLVRVAEDRSFYLVNNLSRKWARRMCWSCGNKHSPERAVHCDFCGTRLRNTSFLMSSRWDGDFRATEEFIQRRLHHFGLMSPVTVVYRGGRMLQVFHYDEQAFLLDLPAPVPTGLLVPIVHRVADVLGFLHDRGVQLRGLDARNVLMMPDRSARVFDVDVVAIHPEGVSALSREPGDVVARDTAALARMILPYVHPEQAALLGILEDAVRGRVRTPLQLRAELDRLEASGGLARVLEFPGRALSDIGLHRAHNEDAWGWRVLPDGTRLVAVADGMGGHSRGDVASRVAVHASLEALAVTVAKGLPAGNGLEKAVESACIAANVAVASRRRQEGGTKMGSTLAVLALAGNQLAVGHAGDTRVYLLRGDSLQRLTRDHSVVAELLAAGRIQEADIPTHPSRGILTQVVGGEDEFEPTSRSVEVRPGDRLVVVSDGVWGPLTDARLADVVAGPIDRGIVRLVRNALDHGSEDNATVVVVDV